MDLEAPHDDVLAQKDQANTAFLLHGYGLAKLDMFLFLATSDEISGELKKWPGNALLFESYLHIKMR